MQMDKATYKKYVGENAKKSNLLVNITKAFLIGGLICCIGEALIDLYIHIGMSLETARTLESVTLIFIAALLTGLGYFDSIAKHAGAGTLVPITGFANAVVAPAIDSKSEGFIMGVGAKMFVIAGPVIVYGTIASIIYGIVYYFIK
ncbi:MAG: stage V sporulation protein AC [Oscillospiraceae bacterium]|nr:stage V sporulation protein AC [Oscillospiraceae bacterium]